MTLRVFTATYLLFLSMAAYADSNIGEWMDRNVQMKVGLMSHTYDQLVSGTNVNLAFRAEAAAMAEPPPGDQWTSSEVLSLRVQCDDLDQTFYPPPGRASVYISKVIRIASTHFADGTSIPFSLTGVFKLTDSTGSSTLTKSWTAKVKAYNKGFAIAANVNELGQVVDESSPYYSTSLRRSAKEIAEYAIQSSLGPATSNARHGMLVNDSAEAQSITESQIQAFLTTATAIVATTHADPLGFCDAVSYQSKIIDAIDGYLRNAVGSEIRTRIAMKSTTYPQFNLALMWCCDTLRDVGYTRSPDSLNLLGRDDAAYAGFAETVAAWLKAGNSSPQPPSACNDPLSLHGKKLLERLAAGDRLQDAVAVANSLFPPRQIVASGDCPFLPMIIRGDPYCRLVNVYLTASEWDDYSTWRSSWYFIHA